MDGWLFTNRFCTKGGSVWKECSNNEAELFKVLIILILFIAEISFDDIWEKSDIACPLVFI